MNLKAILLFVLLPAFSHTSFAKNKIDGDWEGTIKGATEGNLLMIFHIRTEGGSTVDSPNQKVPSHGVPVTVSLTGKTLQLTMLGGAATYEGTVEGSQIVGTFSESGSKWPMTLIKASKKHDKH